MKKYLLLFASFLSFGFCQAQIKAVTETGEQVLLYEGGTWMYAKDAKGTEPAKEIKTNPKKFAKSKTSTFLLKSTKNNMGFWINSAKWKFEKAVNNTDAEYELQLKAGDLYAMIIAEKVEIPLETLKQIAVENGLSVAPDLKVVSEEYRMVNGIKLLCLQMNGTLQGIKFSYYGYYYSNAKGTVQYITYTSQNLMNDYMPDIEELLNGLVELN